MKEYYLNRLHWIFHYNSKNFFYCVGKTLCLLVGVPLYAVGFLLEMIFTFINMLFSWIPVLNVVMMTLCKAFVALFGSLFYLCILTDLKAYKLAHSNETQYEIFDAEQSQEQSDESFGALQSDEESAEPSETAEEPSDSEEQSTSDDR